MADQTSTTLSKLQTKEQAGRSIITLAVLGALAGLAIYWWALIVPFLVDAATNTVKLVGLCAVLALFSYVVLDKNMRMLGLYAYKSWTRWLTGQFVEIDPIGILNTYVSRLEERLEEMDKALGTLRGQRDKLQQSIAENEANRVAQMKRAQQAQKRVESGATEMKQEFALRARQAGRLEKSNMTLQKLLDRMEALLKAMLKMRDASALLTEDIKGEVEVKTTERKALLAGYNAFTKAQAIMAGGGAEREMFDMTMEKLTDDYADKMGEIETFMDMSKTVINGIDLDQGIYEEDALAQLKAWEDKGSKILNHEGTKVRVEIPATNTNLRVEEPSPENFDDLFSNNNEPPKNRAQR